jgi:hypothetical protein
MNEEANDFEAEFKNHYSQFGLLVLVNVNLLGLGILSKMILPEWTLQYVLVGTTFLAMLFAAVTFFWKTGNYATDSIRSLRNRLYTMVIGIVMSGVVFCVLRKI